MTVSKLQKKGLAQLLADQQNSVKKAEGEALKELDTRKLKRLLLLLTVVFFEVLVSFALYFVTSAYISVHASLHPMLSE